MSAEETKWTIAAAAFKVDENSTSVSNAVSTLLPQSIMDNLTIGEKRTISADEEFSRFCTKKKTERISLYLQLESAVKTRDALVLQNLSASSLKSKIKAEEKKIAEIKENIKQNIRDVEQAEKDIDLKEKSFNEKKELTEFQKYLHLFKGLVTSEDNSLGEEKIVMYGSSGNNGERTLYSPSSDISELEYSDPDFSKRVYGVGINSLLTGKVKVTGDFIFVTCDLYLYPEGKSICTVSEIGTLDDLDFIARSIAHNLSPEISASLPVKIIFSVEPEEAAANISFVVDDVVNSDLSRPYVLDSGVHFIRFDAPGFQTVSTSYFFEGNGVYNISVMMKESHSSNLTITFPETYFGKLTLNGEPAGTFDEENRFSEISVNNKKILGVFVSDGESQGFFSVSEKRVKEGAHIFVKPKIYDKSAYIDKRRKWMYGSYSVLLCSLLGTVYTSGTLKNMARYYNGRVETLLNDDSDNIDFQKRLKEVEFLEEYYEKALKYQKANQITSGISIAAGVWFGYELIRYFIAADSVLPVSAKEDKTNKD
ncbi:MAG: hypothetical protein MJ185_04855 [Treponema sp.]|nr:hypothetical protein [Treponema sp.]